MTSKRAGHRNRVVLDGSNIVHGGYRGEGLDGFRLIEAISLYREHGYIVFPRMKGGTLRFMKSKRIKGYAALNRATKEDGETRLITYEKDDDLAIIELALKKNAWIVTNDTFDGYYDPTSPFSEFIDKERQKYARKYNWKDIDSRIWGIRKDDEGRYFPDDTWHVEGSHFFHKGLMNAPTDLLEDRFSEVRTSLRDVEDLLNKADKACEKIDVGDSNIKDALKAEINIIHNRFKKMIGLLPKPMTPDKASLEAKNLEELKNECWRLGLKVSGRKQELVERLLSFSE